MGRPPKGDGKLVPADLHLPPAMAKAIKLEAHLVGTVPAGFRRLLIEEGWAIYKDLGREKFLERRKARLRSGGATHGEKDAKASGPTR